MFRDEKAQDKVIQLAAYFFPVVFSIPLFGTYLASNWLWTFTPSLSYIGQGIIMGFPTTLSMNLVSISVRDDDYSLTRAYPTRACSWGGASCHHYPNISGGPLGPLET